MKKLALALLGVAAAASTASASLDTGFYIGAGVGGNSLNYNANKNGVTSVDVGRHRGQVELFTGYGYVQGCTYVGGELGFTFTGGKAGASTTNLRLPNGDIVTGTVGIERRNVINAAILLGQKFSPSTMFYVRLGMNSNQYKTTVKGTLNRAGNRTAYDNSQRKRKLSFAPGVGLEGAVTKNVRVRMQYVYDIGNTVPGIDSKIKTQTVTLGVAYKF